MEHNGNVHTGSLLRHLKTEAVWAHKKNVDNALTEEKKGICEGKSTAVLFGSRI